RRHLRGAGLTPGRPEVEDEGAVLVVLETRDAQIEGRELKRGATLAVLELGDPGPLERIERGVVRGVVPAALTRLPSRQHPHETTDQNDGERETNQRLPASRPERDVERSNAALITITAPQPARRERVQTARPAACPS